jgi:hypothetical protein
MTYLPTKMEQCSGARELPRRKHTTFRTQRKFEIKIFYSTGLMKLALNTVRIGAEM